jgi:hypothetical protein
MRFEQRAIREVELGQVRVASDHRATDMVETDVPRSKMNDASKQKCSTRPGEAPDPVLPPLD